MRLSTLALLGLALVALPAAAQTTTFTVNSTADDANARDADPGDGECRDGFTDSNPSAEPRCTLRAAVDEANATSGDVVINLPGQLAGGASGSYTLSRVDPIVADSTYEDANAFGDLDLGAGDAAFSSLTIRGTGTPGPEVTIGPNDRVFHALSGEVRIERTTITGGTAQPGDNGVSDPGMGETIDGGNGADGGCVLIAEDVTATLDQVSVNNCFTSSGGNGAAPAEGGTVGGNAGNGGNGGGVANYGTLTLTRSFVYENGTGDAGSAGTGTAGSGGAVGGGNGGNGGLGGGVFNVGTLTVEETTVYNNTAGDPSTGAGGTNGGADGFDGEGGSGGGIASIREGATTLRNTIVADNSAGDDVNNPETGSGPSVSKQPGSDLFDGRPADDDEVAVFFIPYETGTFTDGGFNLIGTNDTVEDAFPAGMPNGENSYVGTGQGDAGTRVDPGITGSNRNETYAVTAVELSSGSIAVDNGANTDLAGNEIVVDGRGFQRPGTSEGDETVDIGGFELDSEPIMFQLVINELDSVTPPSSEEDQAEFVEVRNTGDFPVQLADFALVFYAGDLEAYASYNLQGELAAGETFVFGDTGAMGVDQEGLSGLPDDIRDEDGAVALYRGNASDYPVGVVAGQNASTRVDVLVYNNGTQASRRRDAGDLADAFGQSQDQIASGDTEESSIQRNANGTFTSGPPSPGGNTMSGAITDVVINEVDVTPGTSEFVELWDGGRGNTPLDGLVLIGVNGADDLTYASARFDLEGFTTDADGFFVVGNVAGADAAFSGSLQDGPDAIALYVGDLTDFPNDTDPSTVTNQLVDVVVYGTSDAIDQGLLDAFPSSSGVYAADGGGAPRAVQVQYDENYNGAQATESLQRINDASRSDGYSLLLYAADPTPGAANVEEITVDETEHVADVAGWRLLSSPVISSGTGVDSPSETPLRVDFYAEDINLVQGVEAGTPASLYQAQYPAGEDVMFDEYEADGTYDAVEFTSDELAPGTGFFWYWYDNDVQPGPTQFGGGTSRSFDLDGSTGFEFDVTGLPLDDRIASAALGTMGLQVTKTLGQDGFVMIGNPYAYPYAVEGFSVDSGTLQTVFDAWDPADGTYDVIMSEDISDEAVTPSITNTSPVWQGLFAQVTGASAGDDVTFSAPSPFVVPTLEDLEGIYRTAQGAGSQSLLQLALTGVTEGGLELTDRAATLRFRPDATVDFDRHDGSKLLPILEDYAVIAPVGIRDGEANRQAVLSLPGVTAGLEVEVAFRATQPGTYRIAWDLSAYDEDATATLVDRETGQTQRVTDGASYSFDVAEATDWTDRFALTFASGAVSAEGDLEGAVEVSAVYPNPAAGAAALDVRVATAQPVRVEVYDSLGRLVNTRELEAASATTVTVDTAALAPGVYVVRVTGDEFQESRRLTVVR